MVEDIVVPEAQSILVVESPYSDEITNGIPLCGESGRVAARVLMDREVPIGILSSRGEANISIVNTFQNSVKHIDGQERSELLSQLDSLAYESASQYKAGIKELLRATAETALLDNYAQRLTTAIAASAVKKIAVCGLMAQSVFEFVFHVEANAMRLGRSITCHINVGKVDVFYVWHPSPKSGTSENRTSAWEEPEKAAVVNRLKSFVGSV